MRVVAHHAQHSIPFLHCRRVRSELEPMILVILAYNFAQISDIVKTELYSVGCLDYISLILSPVKVIPYAMLSTAMILSKGPDDEAQINGIKSIVEKTQMKHVSSSTRVQYRKCQRHPPTPMVIELTSVARRDSHYPIQHVIRDALTTGEGCATAQTVFVNEPPSKHQRRDRFSGSCGIRKWRVPLPSVQKRQMDKAI